MHNTWTPDIGPKAKNTHLQLEVLDQRCQDLFPVLAEWRVPVRWTPDPSVLCATTPVRLRGRQLGKVRLFVVLDVVGSRIMLVQYLFFLLQGGALPNAR